MSTELSAKIHECIIYVNKKQITTIVLTWKQEVFQLPLDLIQPCLKPSQALKELL